MTEQKRIQSPRPRAKVAGIIYLLYFFAAILAQFLTVRKLVAYGNGLNLIATGIYCLLTLFFYFMFKPVNRMLSFIAALTSLVGCVLMTLDLTHPASHTINPLLFFGPYCLLIGYLIFRSTFLPHILGLLKGFAGLGWLIYLIPHPPNFLSLLIDAIGICAEASLMLWLIVKGVNSENWKRQAGIAEE